MMMTTVAESVETRRVESTRLTEPKKQPPYHVILLDDDDHTYEYVIGMLRRLFGFSKERAYELSCSVDSDGRVILDTTTLERAEFKRDQIHSFGRDWRLPRSQGSMSSVIQPASE